MWIQNGSKKCVSHNYGTNYIVCCYRLLSDIDTEFGEESDFNTFKLFLHQKCLVNWEKMKINLLQKSQFMNMQI